MTRYLEPPAPPIRLSAPPVRGKVLVLAPHPDDETIGPGGTVRLHAQLGDEVHALFLTAGTSGDPTGREETRAYAARREAEARAAAKVLGIAALQFWGFPDNYRVNENDLGAILPRLKQAIEGFAPDVIYAPHVGDQHSDHFTTAVLTQRVLAQLARPPQAFGYEVWSASRATWIVDVSSVYATKMAALDCYPSQLEHTDIRRFVSGLNAYRAVFLDKGATYGEAFVALEPDARAGAS